MVLLGAAFAVLRIKFEGEDLGDNIANLLNKKMRGRIEIGSIEWDTTSLKKVVTGGWVPLRLHDVRVWDDCALSAETSSDDNEQFHTGDPNLECTPDDRPDPDPTSRRKPRKLLLRTAEVTADIDIHAVMFGNHDFVFRDVWVHGGEALLEQTREPYPLHAYNRTIVSIVTAFYPRMKAGFRAGIFADQPPPIFDLRDIHIENLNLTLHMQPYGVDKPGAQGYAFTARLEGLNVDVDKEHEPANSSYLYMDPTDPLVQKFYVRLAAHARHGTIRILDEGPRVSFRLPNAAPGISFPGGVTSEIYPPRSRSAMYQIELADIQLHRLAQLPTEWARHDFVANTLEVDLAARTLPCPSEAVPSPDPRDGADLHLVGELFNYWDRPYDGAWNLKLDAKNLGPTIRSCIKSTVGGDKLDGTISLTGPYVAAPAIGLDLTGVDFDLPLRKEEEPLRLTLAELHGKIDLVNDEGYIEKTKALVRGGKEPGEVELSATFGLKPYYGKAQVEIVNAIDVGRFLPPRITASVGRFLQGRLRANGDVEKGFELADFDLALGRTPKDKTIHVHHGRLFTGDNFDSIAIEKVFVEAGASHAQFDGKVDVKNNLMDVTIEGNFPDLDVWMKRFGLPVLFKSAGGGTVKITGPITKPKINVNTTLAGVPCIDKLKLTDLNVDGDVVNVTRMDSPGLGGTLTGSGRFTLGGAYPVIDRLNLTGTKLDAAKLCGLKGMVKGTIDTVDVDLHGVLIPSRPLLDWAPLAKVYARADHLTILGDRYSGIAACVNRPDDAQCRGRSTVGVIDATDLKRCEEGKQAGAQTANGFCVVAQATRDAGGALDATIAQLPPARSGVRAGLPSRLAGALRLSDLPLSLIDTIRGKPDAHSVGGLASLTLHLQGQPSAPQGEGTLQILRSWLADGFLGDAQIQIIPWPVKGVPGVRLTGSALAGRLQIDGELGTAPPYPVSLSISGKRIEVDHFIDLQKLIGVSDPVQAWASGTVTVTTELASAKPVEPEAWIELTELHAIVDHRASDGRVTPLAIRVKDQNPAMRKAVSLHVSPSAIEFACRDPKARGGRVECATVLETPAGDITVNGHMTKADVRILARGDLDLGKLRSLLDQEFDYAAGIVRLDASVTGAFDHPTYEAALDLDPESVWQKNAKQIEADNAAKIPAKKRKPLLRANSVMVRPVGTDTVLTAPRGLIKLAHGSVGFTDVVIQIRDERRDDDQGELHVAGNIALDGLTPTNWSVLLSGKIAGKLLQVVAPSYVSQANGLIDIDGQFVLSGQGPRPTLSGTLLFDRFSIFPRGVRRELTFNSGSIDIGTEAAGLHRTYTFDIADVTGTVDDGQLTGISGSLHVRDGEVTQAGIRIDARNLPYRVPTLDLVVSADDVTLTLDGPSSNWQVRGTITVVDGAYRRNFELTDQIQAIGTNVAPAKPFWEEYPVLGSAELGGDRGDGLTLIVRRFAVQNNIATIEFTGDTIAISGTPRDPRLAGQIRVSHGEFRIPGTRASFTRTNGSVDFAENQPANNPALSVTSDADYRDLSGQDHVITATIGGTLQAPTWDLKTSTGYNKSQTLSLLVLGRNQEQLRRSIGDQQLGIDPTRVDPTTNPSQGIADQIVKDLAGDWVSDLLGSSIGQRIGLDVLRIEIGFGSIGFHLEKKMLENAKLLTDAEQTIRGTTIKAGAELKATSNVTFQGGYLNQNYYDPAEEDIIDWNVKFVYRHFIP